MAENTSTTPARDTNQTLTGTADTDSLSGGGGSDTLSGGAGSDVLSGDGPIAGQWQYAVYTRDFTANSNQTQFITSGTLVGRGYVDDFNVLALRNTLAGTAPTNDSNDFGIIYTSTLNITTGGSYTFSTTSDDGSRIIIRDAGGNQVFNLNNDFHQAPATVTSSVTLEAGQTYTIEILYWENAGGTVLSATIDPPGTAPAVDLATSPLIGVPPVVPGQVDGNDSILGEAGNDTLIGGGGADSLFGGADDDSILGETGNDRIDGGTGNDRLFGGANADSLVGGSGNDTLSGGDGNDTLTDNDGATSVDGGAGDDQISITGGVFNQTVLGGEGSDTITVVNAIGSNNQIFGGGGSDIITGGDAVDSIFGGDGSDVIRPGNGNDYTDAGAGDDTVSDLGGNDTILGNTGNDSLLGFGGNDSLFGGADNDILFGGDSADTLSGGTGNDTLFGDAGNDSLQGDDGNDSLQGGAGADGLFGGGGRDTITFLDGDFAPGDVVFGGSTGGVDDFDTLDLRAYGWARVDIAYTTPDRENGVISFFDAVGNPLGTMSFTDIEAIIPCFTPGTRIATPDGPRLVQDLRPGDLVLTRDNGLQPLRWVGRRTLSPAALSVQPQLRPVHIPRAALGPDLPDRDLAVSPQHRVLVSSARAELFFAEPEVLVAAAHLVGTRGIAFGPAETEVTYIHLLFDRHEIVLTDGIWTESFQPALRTLDAMEAPQRAEILQLFPELAGTVRAYSAARPTLRGYEARILLDA